ncbi:COPII coat Sec23p-Sfb3p heterodimer component [Polyrhizophydium stewartii]|uniref:COPII coat Sec23p-Sfb3p heterodimer component n=1 Tax=Polyrhizophydium stewartii TaxID=2732419 RepID=A0ABR4NEN5_9FUNG
MRQPSGHGMHASPGLAHQPQPPTPQPMQQPPTPQPMQQPQQLHTQPLQQQPSVDGVAQQFGAMAMSPKGPARAKRVYAGMPQPSQPAAGFPGASSAPQFAQQPQPAMPGVPAIPGAPGAPGAPGMPGVPQQPQQPPQQQFQQQQPQMNQQPFARQPSFGVPGQPQFGQQPLQPQQFQPQQPQQFQQQQPQQPYGQPVSQPYGQPQMQQPQKHRINPDQIPSPVALHQADQNQYLTTPYVTMSRTVPPLAASRFTVFDNGNCSPKFIRSTLYNIPATEDMLNTSQLPFGLVIQPLAEIDRGDTQVPFVDFGESGPVRCNRCKAYVNPFFIFVQGGRKFVCNMCNFENEVPTEYFSNLDMNGRRVDVESHPELLHGSCDFAVYKEYCARPPKPVSYLFAIDVSFNSVRSGMLATCTSAIKHFLYSGEYSLPAGATVGFITFDRGVHFYNLNPNLEKFQMMVVGDVSEMFVPLSQGLLVDPIKSKTVIEGLLDTLPRVFANTVIAEPALGAACQAAFDALKECGGKLSIFHTALVSFGPGTLKNREDVKLLGSDKERQLYEPQEFFWKKLAQDCTAHGVGIDSYFFPNAYIDVATTGILSSMTSGDTHIYSGFDATRDGEKFANDLQRTLGRRYGFDALLRVRVSNGLKVTEHFGNFYMKNSTDVELAGIDSLKAIGVALKHDGKLDEKLDTYIQAALLYTTAEGQRRVRVHNLSLPATSQLVNVFRYAEMDTSINFFAKAAIQQAVLTPLKNVREQISARCVKILASYRSNISTQTSPGQLILPESYKLYPLYALSLLKARAFRGGKVVPSDQRVYSMRMLNSMGVSESVAYMYPTMYDVTSMDSAVGQVDDHGNMSLPPIVRVSIERMANNGLYLIENGRHMFLWIGREASPQTLRALFGVESVQQLDTTQRRLPNLGSPESEQLRTVVAYIRSRRPRFMHLTILRQGLDPLHELRLGNLMIEDANLDNLSYVDFLVLIHKNVQSETSSRTYNKYWAEANQFLYGQLDYETPKDLELQPKDRESASQHLALLYIKYIQVFRKLEDAYDQILHPQKRRLLKEVVMAVMGRLLEIKHHIVDLEFSDFQNFNDILLDLKLTPDQLRLPVPRFFVEERQNEIQTRNELLEKLSAKEFGFGDVVQMFPEMSVAEAVKIIQIHERGRQGKLRAKYMRDIKLQAQREKEMIGNDDEDEVNDAALKIQRIYRGYKARIKVKKMLQEELEFLGMATAKRDSKLDPVAKSNVNRGRRKILQMQYEEDYLQALVNTKEKHVSVSLIAPILKVEGPDMKEAIQDDFRQWYMEFKRVNGKFPDFPEEEIWQKPGFKFTLHQASLGEPGAEGEKPKEEEKPTTAASTKDSKKKGGDKKDAKKDAKKGDKKGAKDEAKDDENKFKYDQSEFLKQISSEQGEFASKWKFKDESENFAQKHDQEIIKADKRREVEAEIKKDVFEILQDELKNLKLAVEREKNAKGKKGKGKGGKKGGKKGKKGGKGKKEKGKKGKKEKDLTANRTMESLVEELVQTGLLQRYNKTNISEFTGDFNLMGVSVTKDVVIYPSMAELQRVLVEYCVMPMCLNGVPTVFPKVASILLFGPHGTGKSMLVQALATEMGAQIFNLSPRNTAGQFVGKANVTKMVHMVFKVARAQAPSIIYIDNAEMIFAKKVPKDDTSDPKRIKKDLVKNIKSIKEPGERVILIATSSKPWDADVKTMLPLFDKIMLCPKPDYSSRTLLWTRFIQERAGEQVKLVNISMLTRMSDGFPAGTVRLVCDRVLTDRRVKTLRSKPLSTSEFVEQILTLPAENKEEDKLYNDFFEKTPLLKKRAGLLVVPEEEAAEPAKKGGKPAAKKK